MVVVKGYKEMMKEVGGLVIVNAKVRVRMRAEGKRRDQTDSLMS